MKNFIIAYALFLLIFVLYIATVPNFNTGFADSDELIGVARIHGVAHPPGYPVYTMLSIAAGSLPIPLSYAWKINALSALLHALTATCTFFICYLFLKKIGENDSAKFASMFGAMSLAISFSFWFFALFAEVFALNNLLIAAIIILLLLWGKAKKNLLLFLAAFIFGLGLANQQTILLMTPAIFFLIFYINYKIIFQWKIIIVSITLLFLGFATPYLYIPFAASHWPIINWGNPRTFTAIMHTIQRTDYADALGNGAYISVKGITFQQRLLGLQLFFLYIVNNFSWIFTGIGLIGVFYLFVKKQFGILTFIVLGIFGGGLFFAFYSPPSISMYTLYELGIHYRFYVASLLFFSILIAFGIQALYIITNRYLPRYAFIIFFVMGLISVYTTTQHFTEIKENDFSIGHTYGKSLLQSLEKDAVLICFSEPSCFTAQYVQIDEQIRKDVKIIPADFVQQTPEQIKKKYPGILKTTLPRNSAKNAVELVQDVISWSIDKRPVYIAGINHETNYLTTFGLNSNPFYLIPQGCAMKVAKTFTILKKTDGCKNVEKQALNSFYTNIAPISQMIPLYLGYQRYFDYLQYQKVGCTTRAKDAYLVAEKLNPLVVFAGKPDFSKKDVCEQEIKSITVEELLENTKKEIGIANKIAFLRQAKLLKPQDITIRLELAELYEKNRDLRAKTEYQDILVIDPKNIEVKKKLR